MNSFHPLVLSLRSNECYGVSLPRERLSASGVTGNWTAHEVFGQPCDPASRNDMYQCTNPLRGNSVATTCESQAGSDRCW
jgi:hypothetical protein